MQWHYFAVVVLVSLRSGNLCVRHVDATESRETFFTIS